MQEKIKQIIKDALKNLNIETGGVSLEYPADLKMGDYSTNIAMALAKSLKTNPKELAEKIVTEICARQDLAQIGVEKVEAAGAGFINFYLSKKYFTDLVEKIKNESENFSKTDLHNGKNILVEHSSPNLFKPFHIGHVMNNAIGESITRLARYSGATVQVISFPSDISLGVAKAIFVLLEKIQNNSSFNIEDISVLGDSYVEGTKRYDEDESIHARVKEIADNLYANKDSAELKVYNTCKDFNMSYFEHVVARLGSHFDSYIFESEAGVVGKSIVLENTPNVFTESEGAIVYIPDESKKNINTAVFVNSQGNPTYEAKDLGLLDIKFKKYNPDISIFITDHQQISHFNVVFDAAEKINEAWAERVEKSIHRTHGRMTFKGQKMSSRLGGVPIAQDLLEAIVEDVKEKSKDLSDKSCDMIAISALKFSILRAMAGKNIDFDPETSLSFEGDSGPYLQYSYVRAMSVLEKAKTEKILVTRSNLVSSGEVLELEHLLNRFPEIVTHAIEEWSPDFIVTYLLELSHAFNSFYGNTKIVDKDDEFSVYKIALTESFSVVIKNGLYLLGIESPERM